MTEQRPPARPWYDLVTERAAIKGWSVSELARQAGVGRPTIYGWRDNPGKPQAKPVNAVADALGIARERALRLAGIITTEGEPEEPEMPTEEELGRLREHIREVLGDKAAAVEAAINATLNDGGRETNAAEAPASGAGRSQSTRSARAS